MILNKQPAAVQPEGPGPTQAGRRPAAGGRPGPRALLDSLAESPGLSLRPVRLGLPVSRKLQVRVSDSCHRAARVTVTEARQ